MCGVLWTYLGTCTHRNETKKKDSPGLVSKFWSFSHICLIKTGSLDNAIEEFSVA